MAVNGPFFALFTALAIGAGMVAFAYYTLRGCDPAASGAITNNNQVQQRRQRQAYTQDVPPPELQAQTQDVLAPNARYRPRMCSPRNFTFFKICFLTAFVSTMDSWCLGPVHTLPGMFQILAHYVMEVLGYPGVPGVYFVCLFSGALRYILTKTSSHTVETSNNVGVFYVSVICCLL